MPCHQHFSVNHFCDSGCILFLVSCNHCHACNKREAAGKLITLRLLDSSANWQLLKVEIQKSVVNAQQGQTAWGGWGVERGKAVAVSAGDKSCSACLSIISSY